MTVIHIDFRKKEADPIDNFMKMYDQFNAANRDSLDQLRNMIEFLLVENKELKDQLNARHNKTF